MKDNRIFKIATGLCVALGLTLAFPLSGNSAEKPEYVSVAFTGTKTSGYQSGTALLSSLKGITGVKFHSVPANKTMGRNNLLKSGKAHIALVPALDQLFALEGTYDFKKMGPQSVRTLWDAGPIVQGMATRGDSGIKTIKDLKGKRVASYPTYPTVQLYMDSFLAYANLTWDDVKATPVSGFAAGQTAVLEGAVDIAAVSGQSAAAHEIAASSHGIHWIGMPNETAEDKAAWARYNKVNPALYPNKVTAAAGATPEKPIDIWGYNYQIATYDWSDQKVVYWFVKQMAENYDTWKNGHAYLKKWTVEHNLNSDLWFVPRAEGFIQYFKEVGKWTPKMEKKHQALLAKYPQKMTK